MQHTVTFIKGDIVHSVSELKNKETVLIFGGVNLAYAFIKNDMIDEYIIGIILIILERGKKLFYSKYPTINLHLDECTVTDGVTMLRHTRRK